jgi:CRISPR/Cas system CMR-associated protein Cmr5 small subunit
MAAAAARMLETKVSDDLRTRYRQLPVMVRTAGLAAAYAYLVGKTDGTDLGRAYGKVATGIREHLTTRHLIPAADHTSAARANLALLAVLGQLSTANYASAEVQMLAGWLSRLADAHCQAGRAAQPSRHGGGADTAVPT